MSSTIARPKPKMMDAPAPTREKRKQRTKGQILARSFAVALAVALTVGLVAYLGYALYYSTHFFPHTTVNGVEAGNMEVVELRNRLKAGVEDYSLTIKTRNGEEVLQGQDFGLQAIFGDELLLLLATQNGFTWPVHMMQDDTLTISTMVDYDPEQLKTALDGLECLKEEQQILPQDAVLSDYEKGTGYRVIPEELGTAIDTKKLTAAVQQRIPLLETTLDLDAEGVYLSPAVYADDEKLNAEAAALNAFVNHTLTYELGDSTRVLDGETISKWVSLDASGAAVLDEKAVQQYVAEFAEEVNTYGKPHEFKTTAGPVVTVSSYGFGWELDQEAETAQLLADLKSGSDVTRAPQWLHEGISFGAVDFGDTYAEVNLSAQRLYYYKDGQCVLESPVVTGCVQKGTSTPVGLYTVYSMEKNRYLVGENYRSYVNYWMPFNGGVGFHDATWRSNFGDKNYVSGGSHGCVNLPLSTAKELYGLIEKGTPVFVYRLESTASVPESSLAASCVNYINSAQPVSLASETAISYARNIYNYLSESGKALVTNYSLLPAEEAELANQKAGAAAAAAQAAAEAAAAQAAAEAAAAQQQAALEAMMAAGQL